MYGGQPPKLASTMGVSIKEGEKHFEAFWDKYYPLALFKDQIVKVWKSRGGKKGGYLKGLDGRKLLARSEHSLVNLMFQSAGSITVKLATIYMNRYLQDFDAHQVLHFHDEMQIECKEEDAPTISALAEKAFQQAGEYLKINVPIVGSPKVGKNWYETH